MTDLSYLRQAERKRMMQPKPDEFAEDAPASDENDGTEFPTDPPVED